MSVGHALEALLVQAGAAGFRALPWRRAIAAGAGLGTLVETLGIRRQVARDNLRHAFPERSEPEREAILHAHYRELGRVVAEYAQLADLARIEEPPLESMPGFEHLEGARALGKGVILMSGHYCNVEWMAARIARSHPVDVVTRRLGNPRVEAWITARRTEAGLGTIRSETGVREVYAALRANHFVAMLADQDARRNGVFVPFLGRPASTATGPARIALGAGSPIVMGFVTRGTGGALALTVEPPLTCENPAAPDAVTRLTALHVARLEHWVRKHPELWFWLHRRWKTTP